MSLDFWGIQKCYHKNYIFANCLYFEYIIYEMLSYMIHIYYQYNKVYRTHDIYICCVVKCRKQSVHKVYDILLKSVSK